MDDLNKLLSLNFYYSEKLQNLLGQVLETPSAPLIQAGVIPLVLGSQPDRVLTEFSSMLI